MPDDTVYDLVTYVPISGPGVDVFENRRETGVAKEVTEKEMRESYERVKRSLFIGVAALINAIQAEGSSRCPMTWW